MHSVVRSDASRASDPRNRAGIRLGVAIEPQRPGAAEFAREAERLGVSSLWTTETWGYDAITGLAYLSAVTEHVELGTFVVQLGSRTPAMLGMSSLSLQALSGGRFHLGVGVSGPAVMEGWHGVPFHRPVATTRETMEIVRAVCRGDKVHHEGRVYQLPMPGGRGGAIRTAAEPAHVPIHVASMGPANLRLTGELADGWLGNAFIPESADVFLDPLREGAITAGRTLSDLDLLAPVAVEVTADDEEAAVHARRHADGYAFTIGAMGAGSTNFYNDAFARLGFADEVGRVAKLWQDGDRSAAAAAVPLELGAMTNLIGTPRTIAERIALYRGAGITTLLAKLTGPYDKQLGTVQSLMTILNAS